MTSPVARSAEEPGETHEWPGERHPNQWDVHDAHQIPEVAFQRRFKAAILLSEDAYDCHQYLAGAVSANLNLGRGAMGLERRYTYPLAVLSDLPSPPDSHALEQAQHQFSISSKRHIFLDAIQLPTPSSKSVIPPYLQMAIACVGIAASNSTSDRRDPQGHSGPPTQLSACDLFLAGDALWGVMMEVDNREARLLESILTASIEFCPILPSPLDGL